MKSSGFLLLGSALFLVACDSPSRVAGNSANTGNAVSAGRILKPDGSPARGAWVECRPDTLAPWDLTKTGWNALTDSTGRYRCTELPAGRLGVASYDLGTGLSRWHGSIATDTGRPDTGHVDTLAVPGTVHVALPPNVSGTLYFEGLDLSVAVRGDQEVVIPNVPGGWTGRLQIASSVTQNTVLDSTLHVRPGSVDSTGYTLTTQKIRVTLGAKLATGVGKFPLLVRLDTAWKGWANSLADGSDLKLALSNGTSLPVTVGSWDRSAQAGALWTLLDTIAAPCDSVDLVLTWGIPVGTTTPTSAFTSANGWVAAWPLGDTTSTALDRLGKFPGTVYRSGGLVDGVAGKATTFDGKGTQIVVTGSETGALAIAEGGPLTYTCWARLGGTGSNRYVMGRGQYGPGIEYLSRWSTDTNVWFGSEYRNSPSGIDYRGGHADTARWTHLALTISGSAVTLFVDGVKQTLDSGLNQNSPGRQALPFVIGASIDTLGLTSTNIHFLGDISEVWVQSVARSPSWIKLATLNQKPGGAAAKLLP